MRIAVIADTHNRLPAGLLQTISEADEIWHLGDVIEPALLGEIEALGRPLRIVRGNNDHEKSWPMTLNLEVEGWRVHLVHIPPRRTPPGCDVVLHGHTHVPRNEIVDGVRYLNPGCITRPNRGAPASFAWLRLEQGKPLEWELVLTPSTSGHVRRF